ncbi:hypothetical protein F2P81_011314 [Scophthalmus maximus]|uniref:Uncharacterized protein n=1 Tax=Scophthalmus maximus TaxID=52904 RepID=A0A6A4T181_SCOMX|nr:hypothetical protein F2P81_011314 [Scophthalmus maximus]
MDDRMKEQTGPSFSLTATAIPSIDAPSLRKSTLPVSNSPQTRGHYINVKSIFGDSLNCFGLFCPFCLLPSHPPPPSNILPAAAVSEEEEEEEEGVLLLLPPSAAFLLLGFFPERKRESDRETVRKSVCRTSSDTDDLYDYERSSDQPELRYRVVLSPVIVQGKVHWVRPPHECCCLFNYNPTVISSAGGIGA